MKELRIETTGSDDKYPMLEISNNNSETVELSVIACQWSGYGKTIDKQQALQIIEHLQQAFEIEEV
jgi:hypothetical protein